jgi:autotransporter-associated beta strand protein
MKKQDIKVTAQRANKFPGIAGASNCALFAALSLFVATSTPVLAVNAVWLLSPGSGIWNVGTNWSMSSAPVNPGDTATFNTSIQTSLTLSAPATVESTTFNPGASAFTINTSGNVLTILGVGIVNNSGQTQRLINSGAARFGFTPVGSTEFHNTSSAGNATITNRGGSTFFSGNSDGGTARAITNGNGSFDISNLTSTGMGIGSIEGSGNYFLGSKTLSVGGNNLSTTVSGVIQDGGLFGTRSTGGSLTKVGTGTLTLTGANTYTGTTTVNSGSLIVDESIASAQTVVNPGGLLGGRGFLGGSLANSGIVSPGDSPGTLTIAGNYTQSPTGTLRIEVAGLAPSQHDLLAIGGHASLNGTLQLIPLGGFKLQVGDKVTFLTANGGVSGTFSAIQNEFATIVKTQIIILPTAVVLEGTQGSFVPAACNPNSAAVAHALDNAVGNSRATGLINFLNNEPFSKLCSDFTLIAPEQLASVSTLPSHSRMCRRRTWSGGWMTFAGAAPVLAQRASQ